MNILYIDHYAGAPAYGMEYRPYYLSREWVRDDHQVTILAASFSHVRARQPDIDGVRWTDYRPETIDGINYRWYRTPRYSGNHAGRAFNIFWFLTRIWWSARQLARQLQPDVVIASSTYPMDIWVARRIARLAGARLVFELHDLWPLSLVELGGMSPNHPFVRVCQLAEKAAYRDADVVVSILPKVAGHIVMLGLDPRKLCVVPNGIAPEDWGSARETLNPEIVEHLAQQRRAGRIIVGYAGSHGAPNALDVLIGAAEELRDESFAFVLVGDGSEKGALARRLAVQNLSAVKLFPPIPKKQIPAFLAAIDIAYIGWQRVSIYRFGIAPNKLMDYMMAGCVILHSVEAGNDPVAEAGCGLTVPPGSKSAVTVGLRQLASLAPERRRIMGERGRQFVLRHHSYPALAKRFIEAIP